MFIEHPLIKPNSIEQRDYQVTLAKEALHRNTLVVLPTGMGKTVVALLVIVDVLQKKRGKVLLMAPTKPLVEQHSLFLRDFLAGKKVAVMTGENDPGEREAMWIENDVIASTPQVVANDVKNGRVDLSKVSLVIFDEAHRAAGNYAYVQVAQAYKDVGGLVLGMTASPGSKKEKVREVCKNLDIDSIEVRTENDPDVAKYVQDVNIQYVEVDLPVELRRPSAILGSLYETYLKELVGLGMLSSADASTKDLLLLSSDLQARLKEGERSKNLYRALSLTAMAIKVEHAIMMCETQGTTALGAYLKRLEEESRSEDGSKAARSVVATEQFKAVQEIVKSLKVEHPKISRVMSAVSKQLAEYPGSKVLVFTHYRDTCDLVTNKLARIEGVKVAKLVGQADRTGGEKGLKQKEQVGVLQRFREGEFNVLVATSVGEEGLDVASTDLVIFYEPVPSEIRSIQRKGRTGRKSSGKVIIYVTKGTRDQAYHFSSLSKEKAMKSKLLSLKRELSSQSNDEEDAAHTKGQKSLFDF